MRKIVSKLQQLHKSCYLEPADSRAYKHQIPINYNQDRPTNITNVASQSLEYYTKIG